jgi:hypothetical protein
MRVEGSLALFRHQWRAKEFMPIAPMIPAARWLKPKAYSQKLSADRLLNSLQLALHRTVVDGAAHADHGTTQ